jgi:glucosamine--fructose-6-phosphate aminotransferase (isomerizing)
MPKDRHFDKTLSNVQEVRARDGQVIAVVTEGCDDLRGLVQHVLEIPAAPEVVQPLLTILPLQLFAYYAADFKGTDVDQPRNLAKVVTVE